MTLANPVRTKLALSLGAASLLVAAVASSRPGTAVAAPHAEGVPAAPLEAGPRAAGEHYTVEAALAAPCSAGAECSIAIAIKAQGEFHVNPEFPHKFIAQDTAGVEFLGKDPAKKNVFGKVAGDLVIGEPKSAVLTVRFKSQAGTPVIKGTLKIGVCSEKDCQLPQVELAIPVTVK